MRPGAMKGTLRRENENSFFDVLCLITFHCIPGISFNPIRSVIF